MEGIHGQLSAPREVIRFGKPFGRSVARFFAFLICIAILTAAFAMSGVWSGREDLLGFFGKENPPEGDQTENKVPSPEQRPSDTESLLPEGAIAVLTRDLSFKGNQLSMLENQTSYPIDINEIKQKRPITTSACDGPLVLILHTHASEAYLPPKTSYLTGNVGETIYSTDHARSVTAVGEALCNVLNRNGISAIQCAEQHGKNNTLQNSYAGAATCIEQTLEKHPSIQYVIDLHRDGILTAEGELVRAATEHEGNTLGQIMAVVGSDGNGTECPSWQSNLSLALRLTEGLEERVENLCRPVSLRNASYNQELAPNALLLEIGSAGNTQEEAVRSAELVGEILSALIREDLNQIF